MKLSELISVSPGFHRSINIKYDLNKPEKVAGFIPTEKSEEIIQHILSSLQGINNDCASILLGSYGTGKSHLMTFLGSLVSKQVSTDYIYKVVEKIKNDRIKALLEKEMQTESPYLVVPIIGSHSINFEQQLLFSLKSSVANSGINLNINSSFSSALRFIQMWRNEFPEVYTLLERLLENIDFGPVSKLEEGLNKFDTKVLEIFTELYPKLSAGADFDYFSGNAVDVYKEVSEELVSKGYRGIFVIFDEFNRVLDTSIKNFTTLKVLQDISELASRSNDNFRLNILLASHRTIGQYLDEVDNSLANNWRKVEGRFKLFDITNDPQETYDLISRVFQKNKHDAYNIIIRENSQIQKISQHRRLKDIFSDMSFDAIQDVIIQGCLPLHPITVFLLPRISEKLAQNERTLFTFLSGQDTSPIPEFLEQEISQMDFIRPWHIFDYFEQQLRWSKDNDIKSVYMKTLNAINSLPQSAKSEQKFLKTVGIYKIAGNNANVPCTLEMVKYGVGDDDFLKSLKTLQRNKLIYVRQSTNEIEIVEPSDFDLEKEIEIWISKKSPQVSPLSYLDQLGFQDYILPHKYNHEFKITRFLTPVYLDVTNADTTIHKGKLTSKYNGCDGVICYLVPDNYSEKAELERFIQGCDDERVIFALPNKPIKIKDSVIRLLALKDIARELKKVQPQQSTKTLINLYTEDIYQDIQNKLKQITVVSKNVNYFWKNQLLQGIENKHELSLNVSKIMKRVYKYYPVINNELINKDNPTTISKRARNSVIDLILKNADNIRNHLKTAQESFMFDTLFIATDIFDENTCNFKFDCKEFEKVFLEIISFFNEAQDDFKNFNILINRLSAPPYGIRKGVMPVILAACIVKYDKYITIRNSSDLDCYVDAKLLDEIVNEPDNYLLKLDNWDENIETLIKGIAEIFEVSLPTNIFSGNAYGKIGDAIFRWIASLPRFARETTMISKPAQVVRRFAKIINRNPKYVLTHELPLALGFNDLSYDNVISFLSVFIKLKNELDNSLNNLLDNVKEILYSWLLPYGNNSESLISLARNMIEKEKANISAVANSSNIAGYISGFSGYDESEFIYGFAKLVTSIRPEDWLDDTLEKFKDSLGQFKRINNNSSSLNSASSSIRFEFHDPSANHTKEVIIYESEISDLGNVLQAHVESAISNFGNAISSIEKRQVLINILKKLIY
ncbi:MAG TPA: hypothetical protein GXX43_10345 [Tepidanaerobacter syntrophicus]|uniref:hypothetical protein n=1 Tax=Tepidanaerobacter syntrophicus TaxID=224999 RepID=UPI0017550AE4|nr:hypothetical protein [Tepidanaerobacter syntrophicus]HHV84037.1 hypothetical protein [Tepidanaerobacter syntrophicus]